MVAIRVKDVQKKFRVYFDKGQSLKEKILFRSRNHYEERTVLEGISFEVEQGEAIGLIGENGCGKSTLLKLMTRIMYPDAGSIEMQGRVSSLIELGAGFHPDMSGRENIYTNASIFGLNRKEIETRLRKIIAFSELEDFIDNPVRTYSSGMYMRLAFSVAINVDADILLIDEILAVGDAAFQAKCFNKLREIKTRGTTIVIVSHSLGQIEQICDRSVWIDRGVIRQEGKPRDVHPYYLAFMGNKQAHESGGTEEAAENRGTEAIGEDPERESLTEEAAVQNNGSEQLRWGSRQAVIEKIDSLDRDGYEKKRFVTGEPLVLQIHYSAKKKIEDAVIGVGFIRNDGVYCYGTNTMIDRLENIEIKGEGCIKLQIEKLNLLPGKYELDVAIEKFPSIPLDFYRKAYQIEVFSEIEDIGAVRLDHKWEIS